MSSDPVDTVHSHPSMKERHPNSSAHRTSPAVSRRIGFPTRCSGTFSCGKCLPIWGRSGHLIDLEFKGRLTVDALSAATTCVLRSAAVSSKRCIRHGGQVLLESRFCRQLQMYPILYPIARLSVIRLSCRTTRRYLLIPAFSGDTCQAQNRTTDQGVGGSNPPGCIPYLTR